MTELLRQHDQTGVVLDRRETVATFSNAWLDHVSNRIRPSTAKRYGELIRIHIVPVIGNVPMADVRPAEAQRVIDRVLGERAARTAVNTYRVASEMFGEAQRWGVVAVNPFAAIRPPRAPRARLNVPDPETVERILERARGRAIEGPGPRRGRDGDAGGRAPGREVA